MDSSRDTGTLSGPRSRTMRLLREAARELLRTGGPLTVPAAAELAGVSRATAYRYFPNNDSVVLHATMSLADNPLDDPDWASGAVASPDELGARAADLVPRDGNMGFRPRDRAAHHAAPLAHARTRGSKAPQRPHQPRPLDRRIARRLAQ